MNDKGENSPNVIIIVETLQTWAGLWTKSSFPILDQKDVRDLFKIIENQHHYTNSIVVESIVEFLSIADSYHCLAIEEAPTLSSYSPFLEIVSSCLKTSIPEPNPKYFHRIHSKRKKLFENIVETGILLKSRNIQEATSKFIKDYCEVDSSFNDHIITRNIIGLLFIFQTVIYQEVFDAIAHCISESKKPGKLIEEIISHYRFRRNDLRKYPEYFEQLEQRYMEIIDNPSIKNAIINRLLNEGSPADIFRVRDNWFLFDSKDFEVVFIRLIDKLNDPTDLIIAIYFTINNPGYAYIKSSVRFQETIRKSAKKIAEVLRARKYAIDLISCIINIKDLVSSKVIQKAIIDRADHILEEFWKDNKSFYSEYRMERRAGGNTQTWDPLEEYEYRILFSIKNQTLIPGGVMSIILTCPNLFESSRIQREYTTNSEFKELVDRVRSKL